MSVYGATNHQLNDRFFEQTMSGSAQVEMQAISEEGGKQLVISEAMQVLETVVLQIKNLQLASAEDKLATCKSIYRGIAILISFTNQSCVALEVKQKKANNDLVNNIKEYNRCQKELKDNQEKLEKLNRKLVGLNFQLENLNQEISSLTAEVDKISAEVDAIETKRINSAWDLIPLMGVIGGIKNKDYTRCIPFWSQIRAIISLCQQEKENLEHQVKLKKKEKSRISSEKDSTDMDIKSKQERSDEIRKTVDKLDEEVVVKDEETKQLGKDIVRIMDGQDALKALLGKYKFLNFDVDIAVDLIEVDMLEDSQISALLNDVYAIQQNFKERHSIQY